MVTVVALAVQVYRAYRREERWCGYVPGDSLPDLRVKLSNNCCTVNPMSVGFRPTEEDLQVIEANRRGDEKTSDVIRRALRLLDREAWEERARADMHRLRSEDLSAEPDAWEYDADGNVRITGTILTVPARPAKSA